MIRDGLTAIKTVYRRDGFPFQILMITILH